MTSADFQPQPVTLTGRHVRLEPLAPVHAEDLAVAGRDPALWPYAARGPLLDTDDARGWIRDVNASRIAMRQVPFAIVDLASDRAVGSTRFGDIRIEHRGLEIGWTWLAPEHHRTGINTECKYLLLTHAFDDLGAHRVQLKLDARNERSFRAVERIGATFEGILRRHLVLPDGHVRDTAMFSIISTEWARVKSHIERLLDRH